MLSRERHPLSLKYAKKHKAKIIFSAVALSLLVSGCSPVSAPTTTDVSASATKPTPSVKPSVKASPTVKPSVSTQTPTKASSPSTSAKATAKPKTAPTKGTALAVLSTLKVNDNLSSGYKREAFGQSWVDIDNNNCDTREDTLARHMSNVSKSGNCEVVSGVLVDSYNGETIQFSKDGKGGGIDIDHVVALSAGWKTGMSLESTANRESFANDPLNLLPVDAGLNRYKSDKDASEWIPSQLKTKNTSSLIAKFDCPYVARQIAVKSKYGMWVTTSEKSRMNTVLNACPTIEIPNGSDVVVNVNTDKGNNQAVESKTTTTKKATAPTKKAAPVTKKPTSGKSDPDMGTCGKAKSAGYGPYHKGSVEYGYYRDGDGDGTVCE